MMIRLSLAFVFFLVVAGLVYIRLAPFDADRFHKVAAAVEVGDYPGRNSFVAVREITASPDVVLEALDGLILQTPRSKRLVGVPGAELITYETRSALFGFPDYTIVSIVAPGTVGNAAPLLMIRGQARFGLEDLGVNAARIKAWLDQLGPLTVEL